MLFVTVFDKTSRIEVLYCTVRALKSMTVRSVSTETEKKKNQKHYLSSYSFNIAVGGKIENDLKFNLFKFKT